MSWCYGIDSSACETRKHVPLKWPYRAGIDGCRLGSWRANNTVLPIPGNNSFWQHQSLVLSKGFIWIASGHQSFGVLYLCSGLISLAVPTISRKELSPAAGIFSPNDKVIYRFFSLSSLRSIVSPLPCQLSFLYLLWSSKKDVQFLLLVKMRKLILLKWKMWFWGRKKDKFSF